MNALSSDLSKITDENDEVWRLLDGVLEERSDWAGMELLKSVKYGLYNLPWKLDSPTLRVVGFSFSNKPDSTFYSEEEVAGNREGNADGHREGNRHLVSRFERQGIEAEG